MTDIQITDVLVVGAGPVGLTLAIDLARRGIACRIIDQAPAYPIGTRGRGISLRTQEIFDDLDVLEPLFAYTEPLVPCVRAESGEQVRLFDLFRGTQFTLLAFGDQPVPCLPAAYHGYVSAYNITRQDNTTATAPNTLIDIDGQAYHAYGITGDVLILIRPDGYIGLTGEGIGQEQIIDYFRNVIGW